MTGSTRATRLNHPSLPNNLSHRAAVLARGASPSPLIAARSLGRVPIDDALTLISRSSGDVLPAMRRLSEALAEAHRVTLDIVSLMRTAEEEAAALFAITAEKGFWGHVGDFFSGMGTELWDMVSGIGALISDPIGAVEGIWYAINNPSVLWEAIKEPYLEDWNNGRPWRAIGRGTMALLTMVIGTKGLDKALKLSRGAGMIDDAARVGSLSDDAARLSSLSGEVGRAGGAGRFVNPTGRAISDAERAVAQVLVDEGCV